jgi:osmotically inducible protein OsmC
MEVLMAIAERTANVVWTGTLTQGSGVLTLMSGATPELPATWASRTKRSEGKTSPEELLAAALASCFSMAFSSDLSDAGTPPTRLNVEATATLDATDAGTTVTGIALTVRGAVPGIDAAAFKRAAEAASKGCPISRALSPKVAVALDADLL